MNLSYTFPVTTVNAANIQGRNMSQLQGDTALASSEAKTMLMISYALYAVGFFTFVTAIAGLVIAYIKHDEVRNTWIATHCRYLIRTFWISILFGVISLLTLLVFIGYFIAVANIVWLIYRIAKGLIYLSENKPMYEMS